jgi:acyl-CoA thioesterase
VTTAPPTTHFDRATAVEPAGEGVYGAVVDTGWSAPLGPNGGYIAAILVRALEAEVADAERAPRSLTCHYLRPPAEGPCEVHVAVERQGRSLTSLSARLMQDGRPVVLALAAFATDFPSAADYATPPPTVAAPPAVIEVGEVHELAPPIAHRVATVQEFGPPPFSGADEALAGGWLRLVEPRAADAAAVALYADAWIPSPWSRLTVLAPAPTIDLTIHFRARLPLPGADPAAPVLARFSSSASRDGFFEEDGALWAPDGTLLAQSRQLGILRPAA